jgi:predicted O-linked N-acetylglucosamine transferase (SPINDLY family)
MEPFFRMHNGQATTKMEQTERVVNKIRLPHDKETLKQVLNETAELAKVGLSIPISLAVARDFIALGLSQETLQKIAHKQIDIFNQIKLKDGRTQIISQDIDELKIHNNPKQAWKQSTQNIIKILQQQNPEPQHQQLIQQLIKTIQKQHQL